MSTPRVRDTYTHLAVWTKAQTNPLLEGLFLMSKKCPDLGAFRPEKVVKFGGWEGHK